MQDQSSKLFDVKTHADLRNQMFALPDDTNMIRPVNSATVTFNRSPDGETTVAYKTKRKILEKRFPAETNPERIFDQLAFYVSYEQSKYFSLPGLAEIIANIYCDNKPTADDCEFVSGAMKKSFKNLPNRFAGFDSFTNAMKNGSEEVKMRCLSNAFLHIFSRRSLNYSGDNPTLQGFSDAFKNDGEFENYLRFRTMRDDNYLQGDMAILIAHPSREKAQIMSRSSTGNVLTDEIIDYPASMVGIGRVPESVAFEMLRVYNILKYENGYAPNEPGMKI